MSTSALKDVALLAKLSQLGSLSGSRVLQSVDST